MARRGERSSAPLPSRSTHRRGEEPARWSADRDEHDPGASAARLGEWLRRFSLGGLAALTSARAYWPSEPELSTGAGAGLTWVLALLVVAGIGLISSVVGGRFRFRWSWTDLAVFSLMVLVGMSSVRGLDRRVAINLSWEWAGLGVAYFLARNLPRTRSESSALAGVLVATAVAVSAYGLYQAKVEIPLMQARFQQNPAQVMREAGVVPGPQQIQAFRNRLVGSNEAYSTFALANSLAGFLVGPLVLSLAAVIVNLGRRDARGSRWWAIGLAGVPILIMLVCLMLTKSRSASLGFLVGLAVLAWQSRSQVPPRMLLGAGVVGGGVLAAVLAVGILSGRLDREVLTQSTMSLRYRWEYWQGAWGVISGGAISPINVLSASNFWAGVGPGNFGTHYLHYKLAEASEEVQDPHNMFLEVWATAGFWAFLALLAAILVGLVNLLAPERSEPGTDVHASDLFASETLSRSPPASDEYPPAPREGTWLVISGALGWILVLLFGQLNPFQGDLFARWLILGAGWLAATLLGQALCRMVPLPGHAFGAAVLAVAVNLLAAGGIGIPSVALALWIILATGLNHRDDRGCGRLRWIDSRLPGFALSVACAALIGSFLGAIGPYWRSEAALEVAAQALAREPRDYDRASRAYEVAREADRYNPRPWLGEAYLQLLVWQDRGAKAEDLRWKTIPVLLLKAASPPRNPDAWTLHSERANVTRELLGKVGPKLSPREIIPLQANIVEATRTASRLYPTNPHLHARLAEASAEISMFHDAENEAREALRLDALTPHLDKKLPEPIRKRLETQLPNWAEKASKSKLNVNP